MSSLTTREKQKFEILFGMDSGYVLDFSDRTFKEIFDDYNVKIDSDIYKVSGTSKAKRMRTFWDIENNSIVGHALEGIIDYAIDMQWLDNSNSKLINDCQKIIERLLNDTSVSELTSLKAISDDYDFEFVAEQILTAINNNQPEAGLDRLHTFLIKFIRLVSQNNNIVVTREKPLHSLFGEYVKKLKAEGYIESKMTERILKSSISILEAFNDVRNIVIALKNSHTAKENRRITYRYNLFPNLDAFS